MCGHWLICQERYQEAQSIIDASIRLKPRNNEAYLLRSVVMAQAGKIDLAELDLQRYKAWRPNDEETQSVAEYVAEMKGYYRKAWDKEFARALKDKADTRSNSKLEAIHSRWDQVIQQNSDIQLSGSDDVLLLDARSMEIPITLPEKVRREAAMLTLHVSNNQGKSWQKATIALPEDKNFRYTAPKDGQYWFSVSYSTRKGGQVPASLSELQPQVKIKIDTAMTHAKALQEQNQATTSSATKMVLPPSMMPPKK